MRKLTNKQLVIIANYINKEVQKYNLGGRYTKGEWDHLQDLKDIQAFLEQVRLEVTEE